jgi:hypothetical protein
VVVIIHDVHDNNALNLTNMSDSTYMSSLDLSRYDTSDLSSETKALIVVSTLGNIAIVLLTALRFYSVMYHMGRKLSFTDCKFLQESA